MYQTASLLFETPFPVATLDNELRFTGFSRVWLEEFDLDHSIKGASFKEVLKDFPDKFFLDIQLCKEGIGRNSEPVRYITPDGAIEWFQWKLNPWKKTEDSPPGIIMVLEKVTQQMTKQRFYYKAQRMAKVGGWEVDLIDNNVTWSPITKEIHEVPESFVPNMETGINFYKEGFSRDTISKLVAESLETGASWDVELIIVTAKGNEVWVRAIGEAEMVNGKCIRLSGTFQDIDTRKRAEIEYRKISERLEIATNAALIGIWDFDVVNNVLEWDDNMYRLYGVTRSKFSKVFEAWEATVHPDDKAWSAQAVQEAIAGNKRLNMDFRILWQGSEVRWIHAEGAVIRDAAGNALKMIGANWEVTGQKKAKDQMQKLLNTTTYQNESLLNFAHIVSHNLRSHATNLTMLTDFLLEDKISVDERQNTLQMLKKAAGGLNETISHLNEVVQIKTEVEKQMTPLHLKGIVHKVAQDLEAVFSANKVSLQIEVPSSIHVLGVTAYVESAVLNLLTNGIKYRDPNKKGAIKVKADLHENEITLHVKDNGLGIDLEKHGAKLFGMYKTFHQHPESRGIGLFITRNQIESMGGKITLESEPGKGSIFSISLQKA
jgi:signal transduction histidine kinase